MQDELTIDDVIGRLDSAHSHRYKMPEKLSSDDAEKFRQDINRLQAETCRKES